LNWALIIEVAKEHGILVVFFLLLIRYLLRKIESKDKDLLISKNQEIERLVKHKSELQEILLKHFKVERLSSTNNKEEEQ